MSIEELKEAVNKSDMKMDIEKYRKDLKALGTHLLQKGDKEGLRLYDELVSDLIAHQDEIAGYLRGRKIRL